MQTKDIPQNVLAVLSELKEKGAVLLELSFSGGGDSGAVDDVEVFTEEELPIKNDHLLHLEYCKENKDKIIELSSQQEDTLGDYFVHDLASREHDWWNNEGGSGSVSIDLTKMKVSIDWSINYIESEEYSKSFIIK